MPDLSLPAASREDLLARARREAQRTRARLTRGRTDFVRDARVLPIGVPVAIALAAATYAGERRRGPRRDRERRALALAASVLLGTVALSWGAARLEWEMERGRMMRVRDR